MKPGLVFVILGPDSPDWPLCECGCGLPTTPAKYDYLNRGYRKGDPLRVRKGHGRKAFDPTTYVDPQTGCHEFVHHPNRGDYRYFKYEGTLYMAHRFMWKWVHGELPENIDIHHKCGNKGCVNLDHLEALTDAEHTRRHSVNRHAEAREQRGRIGWMDYSERQAA